MDGLQGTLPLPLVKARIVLLADSDGQASLSDYIDHRVHLGLESGPDIFSLTNPADPHGLKNELGRFLAESATYRWTLIDGAPVLTPEVIAVMQVSDKFLMPIRPSLMDVRACQTMLQALDQLDRLDDSMFVLNVCPSRANSFAENNEVKETREILEGFGVAVAPVTITEYKAVRTAFKGAKSIAEFAPNSKSAAEITRLTDYVIGWMGDKNRLMFTKTKGGEGCTTLNIQIAGELCRRGRK
jgi:cellulose biosynthesis protein BcsQ